MDLAYARTGRGEPLVLLHGVGHRRQGWRDVVPRLVAERDVIAVDLPGQDSPDLPDPGRGDYAAFADGVEGFLATLGLDRPHVAGNSLGGLIAVELAARAPSDRRRRSPRPGSGTAPSGGTPGACWGTRDVLLPPWQAARLRRALPGTALFLLPGCGHAPMSDDPRLVAELLLAGSRRRSVG